MRNLFISRRRENKCFTQTNEMVYEKSHTNKQSISVNIKQTFEYNFQSLIKLTIELKRIPFIVCLHIEFTITTKLLNNS
jgi:hypothetical protein